MAAKKCPGCGARYHGRRCPECLYAPFENEKASPSLHQHREPPEISGNYRHSERNRQKKKPVAVVAILFGLFFFWAVLGSTFFMMKNVMETISVAAEPEPIPMPEELYVLYDNGAVQVLLAWDGGPIEGDIPVYLINNDNHRITASTNGVAVNGCMVDSVFFHCEAREGTTSMSQLWIDAEALKQMGIGEICQITLLLEIMDSETYMVLNPDQELLTFGPGGNILIPDILGQPLLARDDVLLVFQGVETDAYGFVYLKFYAENKTDKPLELFFSEPVINGKETRQYLYQYFFPDTRAVLSPELYEAADLGIAQLSDIETLEFELTITQDKHSQTVGISLPID